MSERIGYLASEIVELSSDVVEDEIARSYLQHGDFWSDDIKRHRWLIDSSWLDKTELAFEWYDKVIAEFPSTPAAELAYLEKFKTILGKDRAEYRIGKSFKKYIGTLLTIYEDFVKAFPNSDSIPLLKFQIAQAYWGHEALEAEKWLKSVIESDSTVVDLSSLYLYVEAEKWLKSVIEDGNANNLYMQVAIARLEEIEATRLEAAKQAELKTRMKTRRDKMRRSKWVSIYKDSDPSIVSGKYQVGFRYRGRFVLSDSTITLYSEYPRLTLVRPIEEFDNFDGSMEDFIEMMLKDTKSDDK